MTIKIRTDDELKVIEYQKIEHLFSLSKEEKVQKYKFMKIDVLSFLDGLTRGNWSVKDKFNKFFDHLEEMFLGEKVSILDDRIL